MKKVLIFELKSVCYNSYLYFEDKLAEQLRAHGYDVEIFQLQEEPLENIERYCDTSFDAVIEFNSDLPKLKMEDDSYFLDHIHAPFYDVILDHPLYHHNMLKQTLQNLHVICLDENHKQYILENYPHIKSADVLFLTGEETFPAIPLQNRSTDVLFCGTYTSPSEVWDAIEKSPSFLGNDTKTLIDMMLQDSSLTIEQAVKKLIPLTDSLITENFALHVQAYFLADSYLRAYHREKLIQTLAKSHIPVSLYGCDWDKMPGSDADCLTLHKNVTFRDTFRLMADAKITLNIMPLFKAGSHDRIPAAMLNKSVCVTDASSLLTRLYTNNQDIVFYDLDDMKALPDMLSDLLKNPPKMETIARAGYENARQNSTWKQAGARFISILDS